MSLTIAFYTLGCKQNQFDTELLRIHLLDAGWRQAFPGEVADYILLNTCAVTQRALAKARGKISRLKRLYPGAKIIALGCGTKYQPDNFCRADYVAEFPPEFALADLKLTWPFSRLESNLCSPHGVIPAGKSRALLRIQNGCDQRCAFCIVPQLRGPARSVPLEQCVRALRHLLRQGVPEIVLTGTNIALWGRDLSPNLSLQDLLGALLQDIGSARLRLTSLEPHLIKPEFFEWCLNQPQICRHFHLAVQSASSAVLSLMDRGCPSADWWSYLLDLHRRHPEVSLGADIIAGFPGETERDFRSTLNLIANIPFSYLHVFPFSERAGTKAAGMPNRVPWSERLRRASILRRLDAQLRNNFIKINYGKAQDIVIIQKRYSGYLEGLTANYLCVACTDKFLPHKGRFQATIDGNRIIVYDQEYGDQLT